MGVPSRGTHGFLAQDCSRDGIMSIKYCVSHKSKMGHKIRGRRLTSQRMDGGAVTGPVGASFTGAW